MCFVTFFLVIPELLPVSLRNKLVSLKYTFLYKLIIRCLLWRQSSVCLTGFTFKSTLEKNSILVQRPVQIFCDFLNGRKYLSTSFSMKGGTNFTYLEASKCSNFDCSNFIFMSLFFFSFSAAIISSSLSLSYFHTLFFPSHALF